MEGNNLNGYIDHTILKVNTRLRDIEKLCQEAISHQFYAVCVPPYFVRKSALLLKNSKVKVATVIGFPMGYASTPSKAAEIHKAIDDGVDEIDVVVNLSAIKSRDWSYVKNDIETMTVAAHMRGKVIKVIFETGILNQKEIKTLCEICAKVGANFVKTSTGFNGEGASIEVIAFLRANLPDTVKIKASGGIRSAKKAQKMIEAGADRIGTSSGVKIMKKTKTEVS